MASTALGSSYVLTEQGVEDLVSLYEVESEAVVSDFVSRRPASAGELSSRLSALQGRLVGSHAREA